MRRDPLGNTDFSCPTPRAVLSTIAMHLPPWKLNLNSSILGLFE
jgi:hypothetical protein